VKPNFHYITHIFQIIRDFGPVYGFWTFLFERLNKLLKSYDTNNHADGELEVTFFREFHRDANLREVVSLYLDRKWPMIWIRISTASETRKGGCRRTNC
jgi:hypothetical protein